MTRHTGTKSRFLFLFAGFAVAFMGMVSAASADRSFSLRYDANIHGGIVSVANSNMTCPNGSGNGTTCANVRNATPPTVANDALNNDVWAMTWVNTAAATGSTYPNSSTATVTVPSGSTIEYAALYWGGRDAPTTSHQGRVRFRLPGGSYQLVNASVVDSIASGNNAGIYQSFANVTSLLKPLANSGSGTYAVADIAGSTGTKMMAGWNLVIVYKNPAETVKNITIFDGLVNIAANSGSHNINVQGFLTPPTGAVNAKVGFLTWEGDMGIVGDSAQLNGITMSNGRHPANNFFNSSIDHDGVSDSNRNPAYSNNMGIDSAWRNAPNGAIGNSQTSAQITASTVGDAFVPGMVAFEVEIYAPDVDMTKQALDADGDPVTTLRPGDIITYRVAGTNNGGDGTSNLVLTDPIPAHTTYVPGSLKIVNNGGGTTGNQSDPSGDDLAEYDSGNNLVRYRLGQGANATSGGNLQSGKSYEVTFQVKIDGSADDGTDIYNQATSTMHSLTGDIELDADADADVTVVRPAADLQVVKTVTSPTPPAEVKTGETITWQVVATNNGPDDATGVTLTDSLPAGVEGVSVASDDLDAGDDCSLDSGTLTCAVGDLAVGESATVTVSATVKPGQASLKNTAEVAGNEDDPQPNNNEDDTTTGVTPQVDLGIVKKASVAQITPGGNFNYTFVVTNNGPDNGTGVEVTDSLPAGVTFVSSGDCSASGQDLTCAVGALANGASKTLTVTVKAANNVTGIVVNTANVAGDQPDPNSDNDSSTDETPVHVQADLQITKTASVAQITPGGNFNYTFVVKNNGPSNATGVAVTDSLPAGVTFVSSGDCSASGQDLTCVVGALANGASKTLTVTVKAAAGVTGTVVNTANVDGDQDDPIPGNNSSTDETPTAPKADLAVTKTVTSPVPPAKVKTGETITWQVVVTNNGPSNATGVTLTDSLPAGVEGVSAASDDLDDCSLGSGTLTCAVGDLAVGESATVTVSATVKPGQSSLKNTAEVDGDQPDPQPNNNEDDTTTGVTPQVDLAIDKGIDVDPTESLQPGQVFHYTLEVTNNGPDDATGVEVTDSLPAGISFVSSDDCDAAGQDLTCAVGDLAAGDSVTLTVKVKAGNNVAGEVTNVAYVDGDQEDPDLSNNQDSVTVISELSADLGVTKKTVSPDEVKTGDTVTWQITVTNYGLSDATGVTLTDTLPAGVKDAAVSSDDIDAGDCSIDSGEISCPVGDLAAGESVVVTVTAVVKPGQDEIINRASVSGDQPDPNPDNDTDKAEDPVTPQVDLGIVKTASVDEITPGGNFTYTFVVTNDGPDNGTGVEVTDSLPAGVTFVSSGDCSASGQDLTCAVGALANGASKTLTVTVKAANNVTGIVVNTANVDGDQDDPNPDNDSSTVETPVDPQADLQITKTASVDEITPGESFNYTFVVKNNGPSNATGVEVTDSLPAGVTFVSSDNCDNDSQDLTCAVGALANGDSVTLTVTVKPAAGLTGTVVNTANVDGDQDDPIPGNNSSTDETPTAPKADLGIVKTASVDQITPGENYGYTFVVTNNGPSNATGVEVTDSLPAGISFVSSDDCDASGQDLTCAIGALAVGDSVTLTVAVKAASNVTDTVVNTANVDGDQPDPVPGNDKSTDETPTVGEADLGIVKTASVDEITPGGNFTYTFVVTNNGPSNATGVEVTDSLPAGISFVSSDDCDASGQDLTCAVGALANGASKTLTVTVKAANNVTGTVVNTANVDGDQDDPIPGNNSSTDETPVHPIADLGIVKKASVAQITPGGNFNYTFVVTNNGPSNATGVAVTDSLPAGVTFVSSGDCSASGQDLTCAVGALANGASKTLTVTVKAANNVTGTVVNTANVDGDQDDPIPGNNKSTDETPVFVPPVDVQIVKTVDNNSPNTGDTITYTLTVKNNGPGSAENVIATDQLPGGVTFVSADTPCTETSGKVTCPLGTLAPDEVVELHITVKVNTWVPTPSTDEHGIDVQKVETQIDLNPGQTRTVQAVCPEGYFVSDGSVRVDHIDQGTGSWLSPEVTESRAVNDRTWQGTVTNTASGRAQAKIFAVCIRETTNPDSHSHDITVSAPVTETVTLEAGSNEAVLECPAGTVAIAPGFIADSPGHMRYSQPEGNGWKFIYDVASGTPAGDITFSINCMDRTLSQANGVSPELHLQRIWTEQVIQPGQVHEVQLICPDGSKGIVGGWDMDPGLYSLGNDPRPVTRAFKVYNPTDEPLTVRYSLLCLGDRTSSGTTGSESRQIVNTGKVTTTSSDTNENNNSSSVSVTATQGAGGGQGDVPNGDGKPPVNNPTDSDIHRPGVTVFRAQGKVMLLRSGKLTVKVSANGKARGNARLITNKVVRLNGKKVRKGTVIARGSYRFNRAGIRKVTLKQTRIGKKLLKQRVVRKAKLILGGNSAGVIRIRR